MYTHIIHIYNYIYIYYNVHTAIKIVVSHCRNTPPRYLYCIFFVFYFLFKTQILINIIQSCKCIEFSEIITYLFLPLDALNTHPHSSVVSAVALRGTVNLNAYPTKYLSIYYVFVLHTRV